MAGPEAVQAPGPNLIPRSHVWTRPGGMLDDTQLTEMQQQACDLVRGAGAILLRYFDQPLSIDYKSANNRNPVTDADHASDEYLRGELSRRFPEHGLVTEETESESDDPKEITWVVDPLDGTTNFLHGLPMFASMVCALERGAPVAGAIYIPYIGSPDGRVIHTRRGGGAFEDDRPLTIEASDPPRRMASVPGYFLRMFTHRRNMRRRLGDLRNTGSAGYEMAMTARGVFDYTVFSGPWVWDLATGNLAVQEAGGAVMLRKAREKEWAPFESFASSAGVSPRPSELRRWRGTLVLGRRETVERITSGVSPKTYPIRQLRQRAARMFGKGPPPESAPAAPRRE